MVAKSTSAPWPTSCPTRAISHGTVAARAAFGQVDAYALTTTRRFAARVPNWLMPRGASAAATLCTRTLTALYNTRGTPTGAWLDGLHRTLDDAVAAAYGWPLDLPDTEVLSRLLALNQARLAS